MINDEKYKELINHIFSLSKRFKIRNYIKHENDVEKIFGLQLKRKSERNTFTTIDWAISRYCNLSIDFIEYYSQHLSWNNILQFQKLNEQIIIKHIHLVNYPELLFMNKKIKIEDFSIEFLEKYFIKFKRRFYMGDFNKFYPKFSDKFKLLYGKYFI